MASSDFRKINIDQYDEDVLLEEDLYDHDPRDPATVLADTKQKATAVRGLIAKCVYFQLHKAWVGSNGGLEETSPAL